MNAAGTFYFQQNGQTIVTETDNLIFVRVFVREIAVKIPSQKTHLGNLTCDFPDERSVPFWNPQVMHF